MPKEIKKTEYPENWDEDEYLRNNPDVEFAVKNNAMESGYYHYLHHGRKEGRNAAWLQSSINDALTRDCLDPWNHIEINPNLEFKPCCKKGPIAKLSKTDNVITIRNSEPFRMLRKQLLEGDLKQECKSCHIRPLISLRNFQSKVNYLSLDHNLDNELLAHPLKELRIEVTTNCNLRCVYCPVSQAWYKGIDLAEDNFDLVLSLVEETEKDTIVSINGHGETTFHPKWAQLCNEILRLNREVSIITNLGKPLHSEEVKCMARLNNIQVSIDSVDDNLLSSIRRKVKISTILENITRIRDEAESRGISPEFGISCGVYDKNYKGIPDVCKFAIENKFLSVTFWQLVKYEDIPESINVYPINTLKKEIVLDAINVIESSISLLRSSGISASVAGDFIANWKNTVKS